MDSIGPPSVRDHLANERTLLAWVRTALTVIGLGLLIDRFAAQGTRTGWDAYVGIVMVLFGAFLAVAGGYTFLKTRRDLVAGTYRTGAGLYLAVVGLVVVGAIAVAVYLLSS